MTGQAVRTRQRPWLCSVYMKGTTMEHETEAQPQETPRRRWQRRMAARPAVLAQTTWGMEVAPLYTPEDMQHLDYDRDLGYPGEFPFTRGVYPSMYRGRLWTFREYAGFGTAEDSNARLPAGLSRPGSHPPAGWSDGRAVCARPEGVTGKP